MSARWTQLAQSDLNALATKANSVLLPLVNAAIASGDWPATPFDVAITPTPPSAPFLQSQPNFDFSGAPSSWVEELNRIRNDYWNLIFKNGLVSGTPLSSGVYLNSANLVSGPWIVGVNDPATFPGVNPTGGPLGNGALDPAWQGILTGSVNGFAVYKNVRFLYALSDAFDGVTITGKLNGVSFGSWSNADAAIGLHPTSAVMQVNCGDPPGAGDVQWIVTPANTKGVWIANTLPVPALNVYLDQDMPPYIGGGLIATGRDLYEAATTPILVAVAPDLPRLPSNQIGPIPTVDNPPTTQRDNTTPVLASGAREQGLLPHGAQYNLLSRLNQPRPTAWLVRRDTDFVPFNFGFNLDDTEVIAPNLVAWADGTPFTNVLNIPAGTAGVKLRLVQSSSAKIGWQNGLLQYGAALAQSLAIFVSKSGNIPNPADASTYDFVTWTNSVTLPGDGGFGYLAAVKAEGNINYAIGLGVPRGAYNIAYNYKYGDLVTSAGLTYKFINATPTTGAALTDTSFWQQTANVPFDLITELDSVINPQRQYFPVAHECFSYSLAAPRSSISSELPVENQPVPQNGYCIFKVRAKRWPVQGFGGISQIPSSGPEITVLLGQNQVQPDGTSIFAPFATIEDIIGAGDSGTAGSGDTSGASGGAGGIVGNFVTITIPAGQPDSGDVEVFIPVLGGNELVWQCATPVLVEAFANWQPKFFSSCYNIFYDDSAGGSFYSSAAPTTWPTCLQFANFFDISAANYSPAPPNPWSGTKCLFPMAPEIYNDLEACLNLL